MSQNVRCSGHCATREHTHNILLRVTTGPACCLCPPRGVCAATVRCRRSFIGERRESGHSTVPCATPCDFRLDRQQPRGGGWEAGLVMLCLRDRAVLTEIHRDGLVLVRRDRLKLTPIGGEMLRLTIAG